MRILITGSHYASASSANRICAQNIALEFKRQGSVARRWCRSITGRSNKVYSNQNYMDFVLNHINISKKSHPCVVPNFDHSPRSANRGFILHNATPEKWQEYCQKIFLQIV